MIRLILALSLLLGFSAFAQEPDESGLPSWRLGTGQKVGPDTPVDATGRPYEWLNRQQNPAQGKVKVDAYGPGIGMDETGQPVFADPLN